MGASGGVPAGLKYFDLESKTCGSQTLTRIFPHLREKIGKAIQFGQQRSQNKSRAAVQAIEPVSMFFHDNYQPVLIFYFKNITEAIRMQIYFAPLLNLNLNREQFTHFSKQKDELDNIYSKFR